MFIESHPADPKIHAAAVRIARRCRYIIQAILREEEWADAEREFYREARAALEELRSKQTP